MGRAESYPIRFGDYHGSMSEGQCEFFKMRKLDRVSLHLSNVLDFTTTFGQPAPCLPAVPSRELSALRHKLLVEESEELVVSDDLTGCLDAVCDQLYVALGNAVACGFSAEHINRGLSEVHRSNMTKLWTMREINERMAYERGLTIDLRSKPTELDDRVHVVRSSTGKILKPPGYSPADLSWIEEEA